VNRHSELRIELHACIPKLVEMISGVSVRHRIVHILPSAKVSSQEICASLKFPDFPVHCIHNGSQLIYTSAILAGQQDCNFCKHNSPPPYRKFLRLLRLIMRLAGVDRSGFCGCGMKKDYEINEQINEKPQNFRLFRNSSSFHNIHDLCPNL
jgi:hypothetical protein